MQDLPLDKLGYTSVDQYIRSIPHCAYIKQNRDGVLVVQGVATEETQHVANLVSGQKKAKKRSSSSRGRRGLSSRPLHITRRTDTSFPGSTFSPRGTDLVFGSTLQANFKISRLPFNGAPRGRFQPGTVPQSSYQGYRHSRFPNPMSTATNASKGFGNPGSQDSVSMNSHAYRGFRNTTSQSSVEANSKTFGGFGNTRSQSPVVPESKTYRGFGNSRSQSPGLTESDTQRKDAIFAKPPVKQGASVGMSSNYEVPPRMRRLHQGSQRQDISVGSNTEPLGSEQEDTRATMTNGSSNSFQGLLF